MKKLFIIVTLFTLAVENGKTQTTWEKLFGAKSTDVFRCVREVPAGGYVAAGYTADFTANDTDAFVVRLNISGDTIWTFKYNGPLSKKDLFYKVIPTSDGGFVLCGYTTSVTGISDDALYLKLNSSGQQQWVKFYGGSGKERAQDIIQTADNGYAIVGYTTTAPAQYFDAFLIRTDVNGDTLWTKRYGTSGYDDANSIKILSDGGFILGGKSDNGLNQLDLYLIRTNSVGIVLWSKRFGSPKNDNIEEVTLLSDGFILAGNTYTDSTGDDGYLVKTDTGGTVIWSKSYGGSQPDDFHTVEITSDGGFIASGTTSSSGPLDDFGAPSPNMWLTKTNSTGDTLWSRTFGGASHDHGYSGQQTTDGGYIIAGHTGSFRNNEEGYIVKTDTSGKVTNHLTYTTVYDIISPSSSICGGANTQIKLRLLNLSNYTLANIPVTIQITGALTQTINQTFSASSDTVTFTTTINTSAGGTYTFNCFTNNNNDVYPARNSITKTFTIEIPLAAPTVTNNARCGNGTVALAASSAGSIYWFTVSSGGSSINTGQTYTTPSLSSTTTYYVQTGINCVSARVPVVATVNPISANPFTVGDSRCGSGTLTLTATAPDPITWYDAPSGGSSVGTGLSFTTPVLTTTTNYYAQATNGSCPSNRILATATVSSVAPDPVTNSSQHCGTGTLTLGATASDPVIWFDAASGGNQVGFGPTLTTPVISSTTTYYAQANNGTCPSNRIATVATILPLPTINLGSDTVVTGLSYLLDAGSGFNSYLWSTTETTQTISISSTGTFCVTVTDASNCSNNDCVFIDLINGVSEFAQNKLFSVYPNPATGIITISFPSSLSIVKTEVMNITGEVVKRIDTNNSSSVIVDLSSFSKGVYLLKINTDSYSEMQKLIVQ